ncbi:hypothetical protein PMAYCL1PPCAC_22260, partial [Pristionchus mayeri]
SGLHTRCARDHKQASNCRHNADRSHIFTAHGMQEIKGTSVRYRFDSNLCQQYLREVCSNVLCRLDSRGVLGYSPTDLPYHLPDCGIPLPSTLSIRCTRCGRY